jgi:hypothetical protein
VEATVTRSADPLSERCSTCLYCFSCPRLCYASVPTTPTCPFFVMGLAFLTDE